MYGKRTNKWEIYNLIKDETCEGGSCNKIIKKVTKDEFGALGISPEKDD